MGIPVFMTRIVPLRANTPTTSNSWWLKGDVGSTQYVPSTSTTPYYFLATNKSSAGAGKSFLQQIADTLAASSGVAWTAKLNANLKIVFAHNNGVGQTLFMSAHLAWMLGLETGATHQPSDSFSVPVPVGAGGYTAPYRSPWLWCPEERVCWTEPALLDPMVHAGIMTSAGSVSRAQDGTASYTSMGVQRDIVLGFRAIEGMYRARADYSADNVLHQREDMETWWEHGPGPAGRSFLVWRDKDLLINTATPAAGSAAPYNYFELNPSAELHAAPTIQPTADGNLLWWDARVGGFLTRRKEAIYT